MACGKGPQEGSLHSEDHATAGAVAKAGKAAMPAPDERRFSKFVIESNLNEPTELTVLPDGGLLMLERHGAVKLYDPASGKLRKIQQFSVYTRFEDGLLGITRDPQFASNRWLYVYYSDPGHPRNVLSRFTLTEHGLDPRSEKRLLEVPTQREECCHTGGSLTFGPDGNLYLSTGDNSSPFATGFSPSDERPGRSPFDAQKSSANTNDLRGKILRIRPEPDGTYSIPEGNLFAKGEEKTRPEIYVMGVRNPYRISIDAGTGMLFWGDVGPDAAEDDASRGPRGYDEINAAKAAGNYGWPYALGDNYAYGRFDFAANEVLSTWDPRAPVNLSPHNTGKRELPGARPALIWYPTAPSPEFPVLGEGARTAMVGPVYYSEHYVGVATAFPAYFDGKLMIYDFMRNWIFLLSLDEASAIRKLEPFMPNTVFSSIIDMEYGPDGRLYLLEYGPAWFKQNREAKLVRIDYHGGDLPAADSAAPPDDDSQARDLPAGRKLIDGGDCRGCHLDSGESAGPGFAQIRERYGSREGTVDLLASKVIRGGAGQWGDRSMAPHPHLRIEDVRTMVEYILAPVEASPAQRQHGKN